MTFDVHSAIQMLFTDMEGLEQANNVICALCVENSLHGEVKGERFLRNRHALNVEVLCMSIEEKSQSYASDVHIIRDAELF
jgi:hypothetical protein